jgi:hypothetical protein
MKDMVDLVGIEPTTFPAGRDAQEIYKEHEGYGGPGRDRTDDLFHAMEARSQLRHRPTSGLHLFSPTGMKSSNQRNRRASKQVKGLFFLSMEPIV